MIPDPSSPQTAKSKSPMLVIAVVGIAVVLIALVAAVAMSRGSSEEDTGTVKSTTRETADVEVTGKPLGQFTDPASDVAIGEKAPQITGVDFEGNTVTIGGATGETQLIYMGAHWCPHCQRSIPELTKKINDSKSEVSKVEVTAVSTLADKTRENWPPSAWFAEEKWPANVLIDDTDNTVFTTFGGTGTPFWVFIDRNGIVQYRYAGELDDAGVEDVLFQLSRIGA